MAKINMAGGGDAFMPEYWPANKLIGILEHVLVEAKDIIGQLTSDQIKDLAAEKITGQLTDGQLKEIAAAKVAGQLTNAQIKELEAAKVSGQLVDAQIKEMTAGKIKGLLSASQIESLEATKITGQLTSEQIKELEAAKISGQISKAQIAAEAISTEKLAALSVTAGKIAVEAITAEKIAAGTITANKLAASSVTAEKLAAESVEATKIKALAITTEKLAVEAVTAAKIAANAITAEKILAESITAIKIAAGAVLATKIAAEAITTEKLAAGAVTATKLTVAELSAISANLGNVTAGEMHAVDIFLPQSTGEFIKSPSELSWENHEKIYGISPTETEDVLVLQAGGVVTAKDRRGYIKVRARKISAPTGYVEKTVINGNSESDFIQHQAGVGVHVVRSGAVSAAGGVLNGSGFTVTRLSAGLYRITLTASLSSAGSLFVEVNGPFTQIHKTTGPSNNTWEVQINGFEGLGGGTVTLKATDENFSFYIMQH